MLVFQGYQNHAELTQSVLSMLLAVIVWMKYQPNQNQLTGLNDDGTIELIQ